MVDLDDEHVAQLVTISENGGSITFVPRRDITSIDDAELFVRVVSDRIDSAQEITMVAFDLSSRCMLSSIAIGGLTFAAQKGLETVVRHPSPYMDKLLKRFGFESLGIRVEHAAEEKSNANTLQIKNRTNEIESLYARFRKEVLESFFQNEMDCDMASYALVELLNNAYEHGNRRDEKKNILFEWQIKENRLTFSIEDEGEGFTPVIPDEPPPLGQPRGRGLWSIVIDADSLGFNKTGNRVTIVYSRKGDSNANR